MNRRKLIALFLLSTLTLIIGLVPLRAQDPTPIKIGVAVAQSGTASPFGVEQVIGAEIAEAYFNELGGVNGVPIDIIFQDAGTDENGAINAFNVLMNQENVVGIMGPTLSQQAFAAVPEADRVGVPVIAPSNTAAGIPQISPFNARVSAPVTVLAPIALSTAVELEGVSRAVVIFARNDAFSSSETTLFQSAASEIGLEVATVLEYETTDTSFDILASDAIGNSPDVIVISGLAVDGGTLVRTLRELGYEGVIVGGNGFNTPNIFPICQEYCDGIIVAQAYNNQVETEINLEFRALYEEREGRLPGQFPAQAFTGIQVFVEALTELDNTVGLASFGDDLAGLRSALNDTLLTLEYDTPIGIISFDPDGEIIQGNFYVAQVVMNDDAETGSFELLVSVTVAEDEAEATEEPVSTPES
ncbi:MAG: ABC transporter substrate-binding protein [Anaerolineae bacterium]|nr:ABC transporter substrate-binding protein [Anaerolineae bacterium]